MSLKKKKTNILVPPELVFLGGSNSKDCLQCRRPEFNPWSGRSPGEGNGIPLQFSYLENSMDRGAWWATVHGVTKESDMTEQLTLSAVFRVGLDYGK